MNMRCVWVGMYIEKYLKAEAKKAMWEDNHGLKNKVSTKIK